MSLKDLLANVAETNFSDFEHTFESVMSERIQDVLESKYDEMFELSEAEIKPVDIKDKQSPVFKSGGALAHWKDLDDDIKNGNINPKSMIKSVIEKQLTTDSKVLNKIEKDFKAFLTKTSRKFKNVKILTQQKKAKSIYNKVAERGKYKSMMEITDYVRGAILFETPEEAKKYVQDLQRKHGNVIKELEDKSQKGTDKKFGEDGDRTMGYYGGYHLLIEIGGMLCEIQVMSKKLWGAKHAGHQIYTANRNDINATPKGDEQLSKKIFARGNLPEEFEDDFLDVIFEDFDE